EAREGRRVDLAPLRAQDARALLPAPAALPAAVHEDEDAHRRIPSPQYALRPPSAGITAPLIMRDSSEARKRAMWAMSSGSPIANGCRRRSSMPSRGGAERSASAGPRRLRILSESTTPGQMALARIPRGPYSPASARVSARIAPFA